MNYGSNSPTFSHYGTWTRERRRLVRDSLVEFQMNVHPLASDCKRSIFLFFPHSLPLVLFSSLFLFILPFFLIDNVLSAKRITVQLAPANLFIFGV